MTTNTDLEINRLKDFLNTDKDDHLNLQHLNYKQVKDLLEVHYNYEVIDRDLNSSDIAYTFTNPIYTITAERCLYTDEWNFYKEIL